MLKLNRRVSGGATTLADEIKRLSGLFSQSHDAVIAIDDAQHIVFANQMAVSMFGWQTEGDLIDKPVRTILPGKNAWLSGFDKGKDSDVDPSDSRSSHLSQVVACRADGAHFNIYLR
ncbi:MAG TPA: hypothetical protein DCG04_03030, partial [Rhodospirillaceae bacterium]|nr:hypothetical protein [Rhodospirillaceae bacterium]